MKTSHTYLEYITFLFEDKLKNSIFGLVKDENMYSYHLKDIEKCSRIEKEQHLTIVDAFLNDFKSHFINNTPLNFVYGDNVEIYYHFSHSIFHHIIHEDTFNNQDFSVEKPTSEQLLKIGHLFKEGTIRVDTLIDNLTSTADVNWKDYKDFILFMMTISNEHSFTDYNSIIRNIKAEVGTFAKLFSSEQDKKVKDTFKIYLGNRQDFIKKLDSEPLEEYILNRIKKSLAPKYWSEMLFAFSHLENRKIGVVKDNLIEVDPENIYHLNFNKGALYNFCPSILNEKDLINIFGIITKAIDGHKPEEIHMLHYYQMADDLKVMFSGNIDQTYVTKVGDLFQKMLEQYNSDNFIKTVQGKEEEVFQHNIEFLNQSAKMLWLDVMLDKNNNKKKKLKL